MPFDALTPDVVRAVALVAHAVLLAGWLRRRDPGPLLGAAALGLASRLGPWLPAWAITPMHETHGVGRFAILAGEPAHTGPLLHAAWLPALFPGQRPWLPDLVAANLGFGLLAAGIAWPALRDGLGGRRAAALLAAVAVSPVGGMACLGETEAPLSWVYAAAGIRAWQAARAGDRLALLALIAATVCVGLVRAELATVGLAALLTTWRVDEAWWTQAIDEGAAAVRRAPALPAAILVAWAALGEWVVPAIPLPAGELGQLAWPIQAADPFFLRSATMPLVAAAIGPAALAGWLCRGLWTSLRRPWSTGLLGAVTLWLFGTMWIAGHGGPRGTPWTPSPFELTRYGMLLLPAWLALAAQGAGQIRWLLVPALPWAWWLVGAPDGAAALPLPWLARNHQLEYRALIEAMRSEPACAIVSRGLHWGRPPTTPDAVAWTVLVPLRGGWWAGASPGDLDMEEVASRVDAPCVRVWYGLDCAEEHAGACAGWSAPPTRATAGSFHHPRHGATFPPTFPQGWVTATPADAR